MKEKILGMNNCIMDRIEKDGARHEDTRMEKALKKFKTPSYLQTHPVLPDKENKNE